MGLSRHYTRDNVDRQKAIINEIGLGTVIYKTVYFDERRNRNYIYEITSTAIMVVRAYDEPSLIITRYPARPSRIKRVWQDATDEIIELSVKHTRMGYVF